MKNSATDEFKTLIIFNKSHESYLSEVNMQIEYLLSPNFKAENCFLYPLVFIIWTVSLTTLSASYLLQCYKVIGIIPPQFLSFIYH